MIQALFRLASQRQIYLNILYLLASFPLGLIYFVFLIMGIVCGLSTLIVWIGIPVLLLTMGTWWSILVLAFQKQTWHVFLNVSIERMPHVHALPVASGWGWQSYRTLCWQWAARSRLKVKWMREPASMSYCAQ